MEPAIGQRMSISQLKGQSAGLSTAGDDFAFEGGDRCIRSGRTSCWAAIHERGDNEATINRQSEFEHDPSGLSEGGVQHTVEE
jgi:hypothetical protein